MPAYYKEKAAAELIGFSRPYMRKRRRLGLPPCTFASIARSDTWRATCASLCSNTGVSRERRLQRTRAMQRRVDNAARNLTAELPSPDDFSSMAAFVEKFSAAAAGDGRNQSSFIRVAILERMRKIQRRAVEEADA